MSSSGTVENGSPSSATDGSITCSMNTPFAGMRGHSDPPVTDAGLRVGHRHQRSASGVAEQHDRFGPAPDHLVVRGLHVDDARLVQAVGVVVHVPRPEAEHRVSGGGQERARVVHAEVAARMRQDHGGLPRRADRRGPQHAAHQCAVGRRRAGPPRAVRRRRGRRRGAASSRGRTGADRPTSDR